MVMAISMAGRPQARSEIDHFSSRLLEQFLRTSLSSQGLSRIVVFAALYLLKRCFTVLSEGIAMSYWGTRCIRAAVRALDTF